jgi:hypothetical protein
MTSAFKRLMAILMIQNIREPKKDEKTRCTNAQSTSSLAADERENLAWKFGDGGMHLFNNWRKKLCDRVVINACICNPFQICGTWRSNIGGVLARGDGISSQKAYVISNIE